MLFGNLRTKKILLPIDWYIFLPLTWKYEFAEENDHMIFYPQNSDLTIRITVLQVEKQVKPNSIDIMKDAFIQSIPKEMNAYSFNENKLKNFKAVCFFGKDYNDDLHTYRISFGIYTEWELVSINIFGTNENEVKDAMKYIYTINRKNKSNIY